MSTKNALIKRENQLLQMCNNCLEHHEQDFIDKASNGYDVDDHMYVDAIVIKSQLLGDIDVEWDVAIHLNYTNVPLRRQNIDKTWTKLSKGNPWFEQEDYDYRQYKYKVHAEDYKPKAPAEPQSIMFKDVKYYLEFSRYDNLKQISITLIDAETGEEDIRATTSVEESIDGNDVCIKNWSENYGIFDILRDAGIISKCAYSIPLGRIHEIHLVANVAKLLIEAVEYNESVHAYMKYQLELNNQ